MRILTINQSDLGGGAERVALQIVENMNKNHIINNFIVDKKCTNFRFVESIGRSKNQKILSKLINKTFNLQGYMNFSRKFFKRKIKYGEYDLIHIHNLHGDYFDLKNLTLINNYNIPVVITLHDIWTITGRCAIEYECNFWQSGCGMCNGKERYTYPKMMIDNSKHMFKVKKRYLGDISNLTIVTPSKWMSEKVSKSYLKDKNCIVINNGVDTNLFKFNNKNNIRKKLNLPLDKKYILFIAAKLSDKHKGIKYVIDAISKLKNKEKYYILIVGNLNGIEEEINGIQYKSFGYVSEQKELNYIYSAADIFINPTLADNYPSTILESMASGTPVLSTRIGGIEEQIDESNGWLIDLNELKDLNIIIENIMNDSIILNKKSILARKKAENEFSLDLCIKKYEYLFNHLVQESI